MRFLVLLGLLTAVSCGTPQSDVAPYLDDKQPLEVRVEDALSRLTLEEKVALLHAQSKFSSAGVPRLGIPEVWCTDGPHGIRAEVLWDEWYGANWTNDSCTAFPALTCLAASWNEEMAALYGRSIGEEARYRNKNVLLAPGVNIYRTPLNGRNFEYMGEDPYLASKMVVPYVQGVQKSGVAACVKHYALNNQECRRNEVDVVVDDRTLHEIYLPAFKAAVQEGDVWAIMGSYNLYKGQHCCHNQYLLNDILKGDWAFDGVVISDWGGTHDTEQAINNGLDMEFGSWTNGMNWGASNAYDNYYLANPYLDRLRKGEADMKVLDDKARRVLRLIFRTTMAPNRPYGSFATPEHAQAGRRIAEEGIVLLKNEGAMLPLDMAQTPKILVVGENAVKRMTIGGGSSSLKAKYEISPLEGIRARVGDRAEVRYLCGYVSPAEKEQDVLGAKAPKIKLPDAATLRAEAVQAAAASDVVLFVGGLNKNPNQDSEGDDRASLALPYGQDELIAALAAANPRLTVILVSGNAVSMPWIEQVPAVVEAWFGGSEGGNALAAVLFGDVNPSGKLPFTFPVRIEDNCACAAGEYPGGAQESYKEGIFVGYRWAEQQQVQPLFAFGHGLSYTTFGYTDVKCSRPSMTASGEVEVSAVVTNTGKRAGAEVVQLYIGDPVASLPRPVKELKGFCKLYLEAGESQQVSFTVTADLLQYYDDARHQWVAEPGEFTAYVAAASDDVRGKVNFTLK